MADKNEDEVSGSVVVVPNIQYLGTLNTIAQVPTTNLGVISGISVECDRWGRYLKVIGKLVAGTVGASAATMSLPFGLTSATQATIQQVGKWWRETSAAGQRKTSPLFIGSGSALLQFGNDDNAAGSSPGTAIVGPVSTGETLFFEYELPITSYMLDAWIANGAGAAGSQKPGTVSREQTSLLVTPMLGATTSPNVTVRQTRIGLLINLTFSPIGPLTKNGTTGAFSFLIDSDYRPTADIRCISYVYVNGVLMATLWIIHATGVVEVFASSGGTQFSAGASNNGWDGDITLSYSVR